MDNNTDVSQVLSGHSFDQPVGVLSGVSESYPLPSHWTTFVCSQENILNVYQKFSQFPILFDDAMRGNFKAFVSSLVDTNSLIFATGDYGLCRISALIIDRDCQIHLTFWDRRFKGRDVECKKAMMWLFNEFRLARASIHIPEIAHYSINFIKALGFRKEGQIRCAWAYKGKLIDLVLFGILREDVFPKSDGNVEVV